MLKRAEGKEYQNEIDKGEKVKYLPVETAGGPKKAKAHQPSLLP
jgi:hypothetical protein